MNWYKTALDWNSKGTQRFYDEMDDLQMRREDASIPNATTPRLDEIHKHEFDLEGANARVMTVARIVELRDAEANGYGKQLNPPEIMKIMNDEGYGVDLKTIVEALEDMDNFGGLSQEELDRLIDETEESGEGFV